MDSWELRGNGIAPVVVLGKREALYIRVPLCSMDRIVHLRQSMEHHSLRAQAVST